ncbi:unnamed protein product [Coffea canephora]|uniref:Glycine-rich protein n=1 Tax=Coffea canephora TaxID=49390 RepID=A0A068V5K1_COFCA|nr:unnamed protein product [Coffea canephora]
MSSMKILFFCICLALVLMIISQVAARELVETSNSVDNSKTDEANGLKEAKYPGGYGGYPEGGYGGYPEGGVWRVSWRRLWGIPRWWIWGLSRRKVWWISWG